MITALMAEKTYLQWLSSLQTNRLAAQVFDRPSFAEALPLLA